MRSVLFVPGDSETKLARAESVEADVIVVDLEDSVAVAAKENARAMSNDFIRNFDRKSKTRRVYVRINALQTPFADGDIEAVMKSAPDGILLPKARSGADVKTLAEKLSAAEKNNARDDGTTEILTLATEVPEALLAMQTFVGCSPRLTGLSWGSEDLSADLGAKNTRDSMGNLTSPFRLARDLCLVTAAAANVGAIDTIYIDLRDQPGLAREAADSARDGFTGKLAIHPDQVAVINEAFTPSAGEIARAKEIVDAFAECDVTGVITIDGQMLDRPPPQTCGAGLAPRPPCRSRQHVILAEIRFHLGSHPARHNILHVRTWPLNRWLRCGANVHKTGNTFIFPKPERVMDRGIISYPFRDPRSAVAVSIRCQA